MRNRLFPVTLLSVLSLLALALTFINLRQALPLAQWQQAMFAPDIDNIRQVVFHYSLLSRLALALLVGPDLASRACCSSRCCAIRWRSRPRWASLPARSLA